MRRWRHDNTSNPWIFFLSSAWLSPPSVREKQTSLPRKALGNQALSPHTQQSSDTSNEASHWQVLTQRLLVLISVMRLRLLAAKLALTPGVEEGALFTWSGNGRACRDAEWSWSSFQGQRSSARGVTRLTWGKFVPAFAKREQRRLLIAPKCHSCTVRPRVTSRRSSGSEKREDDPAEHKDLSCCTHMLRWPGGKWGNGGGGWASYV